LCFTASVLAWKSLPMCGQLHLNHQREIEEKEFIKCHKPGTLAISITVRTFCFVGKKHKLQRGEKEESRLR